MLKNDLISPVISGTNANARYRDDYLFVDFGTRSVTVDGRRALLTHKEYELLAILVRWASMVVPREELLRMVWNCESAFRSRTLDVHIARLRKKLGPHVAIETVYRTGHRFQPGSSKLLLKTKEPSDAKVKVRHVSRAFVLSAP